MKKSILIGTLLFVILILSNIIIAGEKDERIDERILKEFNNVEEIEVIINLKQEAPSFGILSLFDTVGGIDINISELINEEKINYKKRGNSFSAKISREDLDRLVSSREIKSIIKMERIHALLTNVTEIVNSIDTWQLNSHLGLNLTGEHQTVCIIDSGINYSHSDLGDNYLGGWDFVDSDDDPMDENGHGTHVAGIVAANGSVMGISPDTKIIALRVLNGGGSGSPADLVKAIDWCVNNASEFNITTISMSLGCNVSIDGYINYCDNENDGCWNTQIATSINNAVSNNISVVASTGNYGNNTAISSPACIQNSTPVSSTTKIDTISSFSDRNFLVKLFAPGGTTGSITTCSNPNNPSADYICSTGYQGGYLHMSGTSMSAPVVSGAIALIKQYLSLSGQLKTPSEIEDLLYDTGLQFNESSNNFSRINVYDAILSLDVDAPNVTLISPTDNKVNLTVNQTFVCNATDWQLANATLKVWNSSGLYYNVTNNLTGTTNSTSFDLDNMLEGNYYWNCLVVDVEGNSDFASSNYTLTIGGVFVNLSSPENNTYTNINETNFTCKLTSEENYELSNVTFYLWNSSALVRNETVNISGTNNETTFNWTFVEEGNYSWNCLGVNNGSNESWGDNNFSITYDVTVPNITSLSEAVSSSGATITWTTENDSSNSSVSISSGTWSNASAYASSHSVVISGLSASTTYSYVVTSCDRAGNCNNSSDSFTTSAAPSPPSSSGGGSGSSSISSVSIPKTYEVSVTEVVSGYTQTLKKDEKVNFSIFDFEGGRHLLTIDNIDVDYVELTIESDPINLKLGVGQSAKLNLTSTIYYDLFVKLNKIVDNSAELTIQLINEPIEVKVVEVVKEEIIETEVFIIKNYPWIIAALTIALIISIYVIILLMIKATQKLKRRKASKRKGKHGKKNKKTKA